MTAIIPIKASPAANAAIIASVFNTINGMYDNSNITTDNLNLSHQLNLNHNKKGISQLTNLNNLVIEDKENIL